MTESEKSSKKKIDFIFLYQVKSYKIQLICIQYAAKENTYNWLHFIYTYKIFIHCNH